jgi:hypothetical protein
MRFASVANILIAILVVTVCITGKDFYGSYKGFYLTRLLYSTLMAVIMILPGMYLLNRHPESRHILISASIILATFIGKIFAHSVVGYIPSVHMQIWYSIPVAASFLAWVIYIYVEKHSSPPKNTKSITYSAPSSHKKVLALFFGAACNAGIVYYNFFLSPYLSDISIIKSPVMLGEQFSFFIACGIFLLPSVIICKKFGTLSTITLSLVGMLLLGISTPLFIFGDATYIVLQITFSFFLANFVSPSLAILYCLFKNTNNNMFHSIFWFSLGSSIAMLCMGIGSKVGFILHFPLFGMMLFMAIIASCLGMIFYYNAFGERFVNFGKENFSNKENDSE